MTGEEYMRKNKCAPEIRKFLNIFFDLIDDDKLPPADALKVILTGFKGFLLEIITKTEHEEENIKKILFGIGYQIGDSSNLEFTDGDEVAAKPQSPKVSAQPTNQTLH